MIERKYPPEDALEKSQIVQVKFNRYMANYSRDEIRLENTKRRKVIQREK